MTVPATDATLVLVDDDEEDAVMLRTAAAHSNHEVHIVHLTGGEDLFSAMRGRELPQRCVVMLDLNMPEMDGFAVLERLRTVPGGDLLPVVVYTTSSDQPQVDRAYAAGANAFLTKPSSLQETSTVVGSLVESWFIHGRLPAWRGTPS
jgi:CheY-like chemotaxis protein